MRLAELGKLKVNPGQRFGRLIVSGHPFFMPSALRTRSWKHSRQHAVCLCDCGEYTVVSANALRRGNTRSCGCLHRVHGLTDHPLYTVHRNMMYRCYEERADEFHNYGGRGIRVCDEWHSVAAFVAWGERSGYAAGLTLDRIDVNGNYEPGNCRWADLATQGNNRRSNHRLTIFGETKTMTEWSRDPRCASGSFDLVKQRIASGWTPERAICMPAAEIGSKPKLDSAKANELRLMRESGATWDQVASAFGVCVKTARATAKRR